MEISGDRIRDLAVELTGIKSIVGTIGEVAISDWIFRRLSANEYFLRNPKNLFLSPVPSDPLGRKCVIACLEPDIPSPKAILCMGHTDTVGISDFAGNVDIATDPEALHETYSRSGLDGEAAEDLASGDWIFGRGIFDMKTGVAALILLLEKLAPATGTLGANLVFAFLPDEEGGSTGMLAGVEALDSLSREKGWTYLAAIATDYMTGRHDGDDKKYVYLGTVGKLLPSFYVHAEQSHVGESFKGLDANFIASWLMSRIDMNPDLCDVADGEVTQPPVSLRMQDLRDEYSVQTSAGSSLYFNYSTLNSTPDIVIEKLAKEAKAAFSQGLEELSLRYEKHQALSGFPEGKLDWRPAVMTYEGLLGQVRMELGDGLDDVLQSFDAGAGREIADPRDYSLELVREVHRHLQDQSPKVILYYSPPYYPHIYVNGADDKEKGLIKAVESAIKKGRQAFGYDIVMRKFYPYILDISYCRLPSEEGAIDSLKKNMPAWGKRYELPVAAIKGLSMPVVNIGPFGRDAHKPTERVSKSYSFDAMPMLLETVIMELMS